MVDIMVANNTLTVAQLQPGSFFGELALLKNAKRNASVKAVGDIEVQN
jgi:CRP-like cAMP-binding protein